MTPGVHILSHPPRHPYVDRLHGRVATLVHRDEPMPRLDRFHDPAWVAANTHGWDVVHLHFGHEQHDPETILEVLAAHRSAGVAVAVTVHDLKVPHVHPDVDTTLPLLQAITPLAHALITPTAGCAAAVRDLTGRAPLVIPHGPLVPATRRARLRLRRRLSLGGGHLLVNAGRVRPNLGLAELAEACRAVRPTLPVRVQVHRSALDRVLPVLDGVPGVEVVAHDGLSHAQLERTVADAAALLLPYRWGTHSGLLELAADVGTPVLATAVGFLSEQPHATPTGHQRSGIAVEGDRIDVVDLALALTRPLGPTPPVPEADRARDEATFLDQHQRLYHRLVTCAVGQGRAA